MEDRQSSAAQSDSEHYRDMASKLRELARQFRFRGVRQEVLDLALRYERRADDLDARHGLPTWGGTPVKSSIILVGDAHAQADRGSPPARLPYEQMTSRSGRKLRRAPRQLGWGGSSLTRTRPVIGIRRTTQPQVPRLPRTQTRHPMKNISSVTAVGLQLIAAIGTADQTRWVPVAAFQRTALVHGLSPEPRNPCFRVSSRPWSSDPSRLAAVGAAE